MKENGANVLETLAAVKAEIEQLRTGPLAQMGLTIAQSFDPSVFINEAIDLVTGNLLSGVVLAVLALWYFVRDKRATLLVGLSIPICLLVTLIALELTGRTLNVISLGRASPSAWVRRSTQPSSCSKRIAHKRSQGMSTREATLAASKQVWPALLASTVTAVIVFLPLVFMRDSASQLFADLALTISIAVVASLLVAVTVLPVAALALAEGRQREGPHRRTLEQARVAHRVVDRHSQASGRNRISRLLVAPAVLTWVLLPPLDYLPPVKRDAIDGFFQFPPGASIDTIDREIIQPMTQRPRALHEGRAGTEAQELLLPAVAGRREPSARDHSIRIASTSSTSSSTRRSPCGFPDTEVYASQGNLFGGFGDGRNIDFQLQSSDFAALLPVARRAEGAD